jgi:hypothetical protein
VKCAFGIEEGAGHLRARIGGMGHDPCSSTSGAQR